MKKKIISGGIAVVMAIAGVWAGSRYFTGRTAPENSEARSNRPVSAEAGIKVFWRWRA